MSEQIIKKCQNSSCSLWFITTNPEHKWCWQVDKKYCFTEKPSDKNDGSGS